MSGKKKSEKAQSVYDWQPLITGLPSEKDFDPDGGGLDQQYAWKMFGGLSLDQAYSRFVADAFNRQEDFLFMGPKAFLFYFPVVERYLYSVKPADDLDDCKAWILGTCFVHRFSEPKVRNNKELHHRLQVLADYVVSHLAQYAMRDEEQLRISEPWEELRTKLIKLKGKSGAPNDVTR